jgi:hypothetical protein
MRSLPNAGTVGLNDNLTRRRFIEMLPPNNAMEPTGLGFETLCDRPWARGSSPGRRAAW